MNKSDNKGKEKKKEKKAKNVSGRKKFLFLKKIVSNKEMSCLSFVPVAN